MKRTKSIILLVLSITWAFHAGAVERPVLEIDTGGHKAKIHDVTFTKDGRFLVSASEDKTIRVWDAGTGETVRVIRGEAGSGPEGMLYAMALSPDNRFLAAGGYFTGNRESKFSIRLIDFRTGEVTSLLKGHQNAILCLVFSPNGRYLASGSADRTARIWDLHTGQALQVLSGHKSYIFDVAFSPDGTRLVTASDDHTLRLWDIKSGSMISVLKGHSDRVRAVASTPDGRYIISGSWDRAIQVWEWESGNFVKVLATQSSDVDSLSVSPDGRWLVTGHGCCGPGAPSNLFEISSGRRLGFFTGNDNAVIATAISPDGQSVASAGGDSFPIYLWDVKSGDIITEFKGRGATVQGVGFSRDGRSLAWGKGDYRNVGLFDFPALTQSFRLFKSERFHPSIGPEVRDSRNYKRAIQSVGPYKIRTRKGIVHPTLQILKEGKVVHRITRTPTNGQDHRSVTLSPDGRTVISGGSGGVLASYRTETGGKLHDFIGHTGDILGLAPSADGKYLVSGSDDQTVRLWELQTGRLLLSIFQGADREWVAWTPSGYYTASLKGDNYIGWRINRGEGKSSLYFPASRFAKQFYSPKIVADLLDSGGYEEGVQRVSVNRDQSRPPDKTAISDIGRIIPPAVFFQDPLDRNVTVQENTLRVKAGARSLTSEPIADIWVLLNGRRIDKAVKRIKGNRAEIDLTVKLTQRENRLAVIASNRYSQSEPEICYVTLVGSKRPGKLLAEEDLSNDGGPGKLYKPNLYVVAIGVSDYANPEFNLDVADRDAEAIAGLFEKQRGRLYNRVEMRLLVNNGATQDKILDSLDWVLKEATQKDTTLIFAAGHGLKDSRGNYYFLPYDGDPDKLRRTGVRWFDFQDVLTSLPSKVLLMVDTCHSGSVTGKRRAISDMTDTLRELTNAENGVVVMTASTGKEESLEKPEWGHGAFTKALVEGLEGRADYNKDNTIDIKELDFYITYRVKDLTEGFQHPTTEIPKTLPNFPLALGN